jgi:RND family efflux transporter MFP subunit
VETTVIESAPPNFNILVHGSVVPKREISLTAEVAGRVTELSDRCDEGKYVTKGTLLLQIDPRRYELEIQRLRGEMEQAKADLTQLEVEKINNEALIEIAENDLSIWRDESDRIEQLAKRRAASQSEMDQAKSQVIKARNALQSLKNAQRVIEARRVKLNAQIDLTQARLELAELDLEKTTVTAPLDGVVTACDVEKDAFVQPGSPLLKIQDMSAVEVRCNLRIEDLYWLQQANGQSLAEPPNSKVLFEAPHAEAIVTYDSAGKSFQWQGFLSRYDGIGLDEKTRTVPCLVEVPNPTQSLTPDAPQALVQGMFVRVALKANPGASLLQIPIEGLRPGDEVWVIRNSTLEVHPVQVARMLDDRILIHPTEKVAPGMRIVVSPLAVATDGMAVREIKN